MGSRQRHLLVVEDEQARDRLFSRTSEAGSESVKFTTANTLAQARRYLAQFTPDLVLADVNLPDGKGMELLPPKGDKPKYPLIVMTDSADEKAAAQAVKAGAIDYIVKSDAALKDIPFLVKRVLSQWKAVIKCKQAEDNLKQEAAMQKILLDNLPCIAMILKKKTREIVASNKNAKEIGAVPGKTCYRTCVQLDDPCPFCLAPQVWATNEPCQIEVEYRGKHFQSRWVPLTEDLYLHYIFDITEHKDNQRQIRRQDKRIRELNCLFMASSVMAEHDKAIDQVLGEIASLIHDSCMYPYRSCVKITYGGREFTACPNCPMEANCFAKTTCVQSADIIVNDEKAGSVEIYCPQYKPDDSDEKPFLSEQTYLINTLAVELGGFIESRKFEEAAKSSDHNYRQIYNATNDAIFVHNAADGMILDVNDKVLEMFGYDNKEEIVGDSVGKLSSGRDLFSGEQATKYIKAAARGKPQVFEWRTKKKNGDLFWVEVSLKGAVINDHECVLAVVRNISNRKQAERELFDYQRQLKALASKLLLFEESERRRLAMAMHDSIGQNLAVAKMVLQSSMKSTLDTRITESLKEVYASMDEAITDVHSLTFELSNPVLYEFGFVAAMEHYLTEKIRGKHGLKCKFTADHQLPDLGHEISIILYRTVRELLVNIIKHAKAKTVNLCIRKTGEKLQVDLEDDGVGFDPAGVDLALTEGSGGGFGLFSIRQQLEHFGGTIKIKSEHGKGTCVTIAMPLKNNNTNSEPK
jgi:PAS domain S-box-containing protein